MGIGADQFWRARRAWLVASIVAASLVASWLAPAAGASLRPGIYISGPLTNVLLETKYTYKVTVVSKKSYSDATVEFDVPASGCYPTFDHMKLRAHRPWTGSFTTEYIRSSRLSQGIAVAVVVVPPHHGFTTAMLKHFPVTLAPGQVENPLRSFGNCDNSSTT
jgi:hypothetical protein